VVVLTSVANRVRLVRLDRVDQFVLSYGGLRGAIAFALASLLDARHFADTRDLFITTTIAVIYFTNFVMVCPATGVSCRDVMLTSILEVHRLLADNRYRPFDNRHRPIIGRLFVLVSKTTKNALTAIHIDVSEITNDSVISHVSSSTYNRTK